MQSVSKRAQLDLVKKFIIENNDKFDKVTIFGAAISDDFQEDEYIDIAVRVVKEEDILDEDVFFILAEAISIATNGKFELVIENDPNLSDATINQINKGEILYERTV